MSRLVKTFAHLLEEDSCGTRIVSELEVLMCLMVHILHDTGGAELS